MSPTSDGICSITCSTPRKSGRPLSPNTLELMAALQRILAAQHPMTARGAFYAASVAGAVEKTEAGCKKVQRLLVKMRERRQIPWNNAISGHVDDHQLAVLEAVEREERDVLYQLAGEAAA